MNGPKEKVGTTLDNLLLIEKTRDPLNKQRISLMGAHCGIIYILDCVFDTQKQLEEFDSNIMAETKIKLCYTTNIQPQGYFRLNMFTKEKSKKGDNIIELNFSKQENRVQYYGYIEKM